MINLKPLTFLPFFCRLVFLSGVIYNTAWANTVIPVDNSRPDETFSQPSPKQHLFSQKPKPTEPTSSASSQQISLTIEQLASRPDLVLRALIPALKNNDMRGVEILLPIYAKQSPDSLLILKWAQAVVARKQGKLNESVRLYRQIIAEKPNLQPARLQLAIALTQNRENEAAKAQFNQLRSENLPAPLLTLIDSYIDAINQRDSWNVYGGVNYLHENNVNNAPPKGTKAEGFTPSSQPEKAHGLSYFINLSKNWSLAHGFFTEFSADINGKYYWDNHKYDEFSTRLNLGGGYRNAKTEVKLMPFVEQFWYVGGENATKDARTLHRYSKSSGINLDVDYWLTPNWKISTVLEYTEQRYIQPQRQNSNGNSYSISNTLIYMPNSQQFWFVGLDYYQKNTRLKAYAFERQGIRLGWGQEWPKGISTRLQTSYATRTYQAPSAENNMIFAPSFFKVVQKNREYGVNFTIWHRSLHWLGITPKITWAYQKTTSNNPFSEYDRNRIYLTFSKTF
ncbi:surface lipoprotein assembly modifier [Pasteurella multocida]|uniref:Surface lipoprotein assembly modifier n=1 Tax=Pasteurella multocida TaxID=747 RepID=A0A9X3ZLP9_PASMD|nr:surface lipoprotein assembly modifier [Pasteurella multocida]MDA5620959.1 surface lipoprotein assembly modifier [Pasteurella multocida subsp. multocida]MDA5623511.1 surface lipoprotein assembly modifier [Pasteurella multocida]